MVFIKYLKFFKQGIFTFSIDLKSVIFDKKNPSRYFFFENDQKIPGISNNLL